MSEHPFYSEQIVKQLKSRVETLEQQLVAQRAIVAADDEWLRIRNMLQSSVGEIHAAASVMATAREEAKRIDEETA